jgi:hypothetical protein
VVFLRNYEMEAFCFVTIFKKEVKIAQNSPNFTLPLKKALVLFN